MNTNRENLELIELALNQIENGQETLDSFLEQHPENADDLRPQLEAALWLRSRRSSVSARPGFLTASRTRLVEVLRTSQSAPQLTHERNPKWGATPRNHLLDVISLITLVLCMAFVGHHVVIMSELSLPGELLHPVKLFVEQIQLAFTFDPQEEASLHVRISQRRTNEIIELILSEKYADISPAAERLEKQLQASTSALNEIEQRYPTEIQALSQAYQKTLSTETMILSILLKTYPPNATQYIEIALQVTRQGLAALQD